MENLTASIDSYCERLGPGLWAEPANAASNAAFLVAAWIAWRMAVATGRSGDWAVRALVGVLTAIGIGSFLFHTFANRWSVIADVVPIMIFILLYLYLAAVRFLDLPRWAGGLITAAWIGVGPLVGSWLAPVTGPLNGSIGYVPTLLLILLTAALLFGRDHPAWRGVALGGGLLAISLTFRTLDAQEGAVCAAVPLGTHWLWHLFNGTLLGVMIVTLVRHGAPRTRTAAA